MSDQPISIAIKREFADEVSALAALVDEGLVVMTHDPDWCVCDGTRTLTAACVRATTEGVNVMARNGAERFSGPGA